MHIILTKVNYEKAQKKLFHFPNQYTFFNTQLILVQTSKISVSHLSRIFQFGTLYRKNKNKFLNVHPCSNQQGHCYY